MKKTLLVVEDNNVNQMILKGILSDEYEILEAENGWTALNILSHEKEQISAILLDVLMPVMDGYAFIQKVKETADVCDIPIIVLSQIDDQASHIKMLSLGALDFLPKPYQVEILKIKLKNIIELSEKGGKAK